MRNTWRLASLGFLALFSVIGSYQMSLVVDGSRHFWLYEDQMVSMTYARNLAEGHGLVWSAGERAGGLTNFLWTLVMAGVHLLPLGEGKAPLAVQILNGLLAGGILLLAERLLRLLHPDPGLGLPLLYAALVPCFDLLFWCVNGFETTLLTAVFMLAAARLLEEAAAGQPRAGTYVLMGLLPLIRSDAYHAWAGLALLALGAGQQRGRTARLLGVSLLLPALHLLFRHAHDGRWLPEATGRLSVALLPAGAPLGARYVARFAKSYGVAVLLGAAGAIRSRDRLRALLLGGVVISGAYVLLAGGEALPGSPYLAHLVPVMFVLAIAALLEPGRRTRAPAVVSGLLFVAPVVLQVLAFSPVTLAASEGAGMVTGVLVDRFAGRDATVGVFAPGSVPYFSRRRAIDLLASSKVEATLGLRPDLVVVHLPHETIVSYAQGGGRPDNLSPVLHSRIFREEYLPNPMGVLDRTTVYFRSSSPELVGRSRWKTPQVSR